MIMVMSSASNDGEDAFHQVEEIDAGNKHQQFVHIVHVFLGMVVIVSVFVNVEA